MLLTRPTLVLAWIISHTVALPNALSSHDSPFSLNPRASNDERPSAPQKIISGRNADTKQDVTLWAEWEGCAAIKDDAIWGTAKFFGADTDKQNVTTKEIRDDVEKAWNSGGNIFQGEALYQHVIKQLETALDEMNAALDLIICKAGDGSSGVAVGAGHDELRRQLLADAGGWALLILGSIAGTGVAVGAHAAVQAAFHHGEVRNHEALAQTAASTFIVVFITQLLSILRERKKFDRLEATTLSGTAAFTWGTANVISTGAARTVEAIVDAGDAAIDGMERGVAGIAGLGTGTINTRALGDNQGAAQPKCIPAEVAANAALAISETGAPSLGFSILGDIGQVDIGEALVSRCPAKAGNQETA